MANGLEGSAAECPGVAFGDSFTSGAAEGAAAGAGVADVATGAGLCEDGAVDAWGSRGGFAVPHPMAARLSAPVKSVARMVKRRMGILWKSGSSIVPCAQ